MKLRQLQSAAAAPRSDRGRFVLERIRSRAESVPPRYPSHLDCRRDPDAKHDLFELPVPSQKHLQELFDLTAAEAKLAQLIACGDSVEEVAQRLCIKMTTARTQLAAVFAKTETRRQAKLVAVLSRIAHLEERAQRTANVVPVGAVQEAGRRNPVQMI